MIVTEAASPNQRLHLTVSQHWFARHGALAAAPAGELGRFGPQQRTEPDARTFRGIMSS